MCDFVHCCDFSKDLFSYWFWIIVYPYCGNISKSRHRRRLKPRFLWPSHLFTPEYEISGELETESFDRFWKKRQGVFHPRKLFLSDLPQHLTKGSPLCVEDNLQVTGCWNNGMGLKYSFLTWFWTVVISELLQYLKKLTP